MLVPLPTGQLVAPRGPSSRTTRTEASAPGRTSMLQRASRVVRRARERIRAAREQDPHAWPEGAVLVMEDGTRAVVGHVEAPPDEGGTSTDLVPGTDAVEQAPVA